MDYVKEYLPVDRGAPMIRLNMVSSLDGAGAIDGRAGGLGGPADQALMQVLRMMADVILVGAGTVRVEGYQGDLIGGQHQQWRVEQGLPSRPRFAVVSRKGPPLQDRLRAFAGQGLHHVLCEGGPHLFGSLAELDRIDELCLTLGPLIAGAGETRITAGHTHPVRRMRFVHAIPDGDMLFLRYARHT